MKTTLTTMNEHFKLIHQEYDRMVKAKNYKTGKGRMYQACISELLMWLEKSGVTKVQHITANHLTSYLEYLVTRPNKRQEGVLSVASINHHLFSIRLLFDHLLETEHVKELISIPNYLQRSNNSFSLLTENEVKELYNHSRTTTERVILSIAYGCGLRRSELENLNTSDIVYSKGVLVVTKGKGNKIREVALNEVVIDDIKKYYSTERLDRARTSTTRTDAFFLNLKGERLSGDSINKILKEIVIRTGNSELIAKKVSLHCLRHSITTHLIERGLDIETLRKYLGHSSTDTTSLYMARRKRKNKYLI